MKYDTLYRRGTSYEPPQIHVNFGIMPDPVAAFAMDLLKSPGGVLMGRDDGEDSAGRQKIGPMPVSDLVKRAFDIAEESFMQMRERGMCIDVPSFAEIDERAKAQDDERKN